MSAPQWPRLYTQFLKCPQAVAGAPTVPKFLNAVLTEAGISAPRSGPRQPKQMLNSTKVAAAAGREAEEPRQRSRELKKTGRVQRGEPADLGHHRVLRV